RAVNFDDSRLPDDRSFNVNSREVAASQHHAFHTSQGTRNNTATAANSQASVDIDRKVTLDDAVDVLQIASQAVLIFDHNDMRDSVGSKGGIALFRTAAHEQISRKK